MLLPSEYLKSYRCPNNLKSLLTIFRFKYFDAKYKLLLQSALYSCYMNIKLIAVARWLQQFYLVMQSILIYSIP